MDFGIPEHRTCVRAGVPRSSIATANIELAQWGHRTVQVPCDNRNGPSWPHLLESERAGKHLSDEMKRAKCKRGNVRNRKVLAPPPEVDLSQVADSCRFVGSAYHKDFRGFAGTPRARAKDASKCPRELSRCRELAESWLRKSVQAGNTGVWERGYPRYVWYRHGETLYEARQGSPGSGEYHGYPLLPSENVRGL